MSKTVTIGLSLAVGVAVGLAANSRVVNRPAEAQTAAPAPSATAYVSTLPTAIGDEDVSGPYEVVRNWPQDLATLPGHEKWTYGGARGIFAESPNRVFLLGGGELPNIKRPALSVSCFRTSMPSTHRSIPAC